ncbi:MAG: YitT family protein [Tissierellia bacterium]|nr:YitT family protein [Tissierellia bacterium]
MLSPLLRKLSLSKGDLVRILVGSFIMVFTVINVHKQAMVTEGGVLGMTLLISNLFGIKASIVSVVLDISCYALGFSLLGKNFLKKALVASVSFAGLYALMAPVGPVLPSLYEYPLLAAILGGLGIGVGCGLVVTVGGCSGGDDALAMVIAKKSGFSLSKAYLFTDITVLTLSLVYISPIRILFSFLSTCISSFLIGQFEVRIPKPVWDIAAE